METTKFNNVYEVLSYIQTNLKVQKDKSVQVGGANGKTFKYRTAEGIFENVKPLLAASGATLTVEYEPIELAQRVYCRAVATLRFIPQKESLPQSVSAKAFAREGSEDISEREWVEQDRYKGEIHVKTKTSLDQIKGGQGSGAAASYAAKYALCGLFLIDDGMDLDSTSDIGTQPTPQQQPQATQPKPKKTKTAAEYDAEIRAFVEKGVWDRAKNGIAFLEKNFKGYDTNELKELVKGK